MRPFVASIVCGLALLASGEPLRAQLATGSGASSSAAGLPPVVYWGQDVFIIPYQWSARTDPTSASEVILYMSGDMGASWSEVTRARPDVRSFLYRSTGDGEYWFAVRTLDRQGRMWPAGGYQPELRVVVDTKIPTARFQSATLDQAGRVNVVAQVNDSNLDTSALTLAMRHAYSTEWTPLQTQIKPSRNRGEAQVVATGQAPAGVGEVTLRMAIEDRAGNPAGAGQRVLMSAMPSSGPLAAQAAVGRGAPLARPSYAPASTSGDPFLLAPPLELPTFDLPAAAGPSPQAVAAARPTTANDSPWRSASMANAQRQQPLATATPQPPASQPWPADARAQAPFRADRPVAWQPSPQTPVVAARRPQPRAPFHQASAGRRQPDGAGPPSADSGGRLIAAAQADEPLLMVNQRQFALDYDLQSAGKWGVSKVEVWGSHNGGQTWKHFATDSDNRSPVNIVAPEPGRYGFRILVQGVGSLPVEPPRPGDLPEVSVVVDTQPPAARLTSAAQGEGYFGDHLIISWQAEDARLEQRPIALFYSGSPSGPWIPIASNLENDSPAAGQYTWRLQRHLPQQLFIRLEVRDQAGNVTADQTSEPVRLEFNQPAGRIRDARPIAESL